MKRNDELRLGASAMKLITGVTLFLLFALATTSAAQGMEAAPPLVEKLYNGNWPKE